MKKIISAILLVAVLVFALSACAAKEYTVAFDSDGGTAVSEQIIKDGETATEPTDPTKEGYAFVGWFVGETRYDFATPVTADVTLKAVWSQITYEVTFDSDGGSTVDPQTVAHGGLADEPTAPTKEGYTFAGWLVGGEEYDFETPVTAAVALKAAWTINTYEVTFDTDGGSTVAPQTVAHGDAATEPAAPTKDHHTFVGWFVGELEYDFTTPVKSPVTVKAVWETNSYEVTFNTDGGSEIAAQQVKYGSAITEPAAPTKSGFSFAGWLCNGEAYDVATPVEGPITLTAKWELDLPDLSDLAGTWTGKETVLYTQTAYEFVISADGSVTVTYGDDAQMTVNYVVYENGILTVNYTAGSKVGADMVFTVSTDKGVMTTDAAIADQELILKKQYKVTYDWKTDYPKDTGIPKDAEVMVSHGDTAAKKSNNSVTGYSYVWKTADGAEYNFDTPVTGDITLFADYTANLYTVKFLDQKGDTIKTLTVSHDSLIPVEEIPTEGIITDGKSVFNGKWFASVTSNTAIKFDTQKIKGDKTYYPGIINPLTELDGTWTGTDDSDSYSVVIDAAAGKITLTITKISDPANPVVTKTETTWIRFQDLDGEMTLVIKYIKNGSTSESYIDPVYDSAKGTLTDSGLVMTKEGATYSVSFDSDGGSAVATQTVKAGETATQPEAPSKAGFIFGGWLYNGELYDFSTPVNGDVALTAKWTEEVADVEYTVTFDSDGGSAVATQTVKAGETATQPEAPTKAGFVFGGWIYNGAPYEFTTPVSCNIILTAKWDEAKYTVTFNSDSGSAVDSQTVTAGANATKPEDPTRSGYVFMGWFDGENEYSFESPVNSDLTVKAKWGRSVKFYSQDGTTYVEVIVENKKPIPADKIPTIATVNDGFIFTGVWHKKISNPANQHTAGAFDFTSNITSNTDIYPGFIKATIVNVEGTWNGAADDNHYNSTYPVGTTISVTIDVDDNNNVAVTIKIDGAEAAVQSVQFNGERLVIKCIKEGKTSVSTVNIDYDSTSNTLAVFMSSSAGSIALTKQA